MNILKKILLYIWQFPQNIIGLILIPFYKCEEILYVNDAKERYCPKFRGGISLGNYIYVSRKYENMTKHEYGHSVQSKMLGPLYLLIIGIPSFLWCAFYNGDYKGYYKFYTEKWADKLGNVKR